MYTELNILSLSFTKKNRLENLLSCQSRYCSWDDKFAIPIACLFFFFFDIWKEDKKVYIWEEILFLTLSIAYSFTSSLKEVSLSCLTLGPTRWSSNAFHWVCGTVNLFWQGTLSFLKCCMLIERNDLASIISFLKYCVTIRKIRFRDSPRVKIAWQSNEHLWRNLTQ